MNFNMSTRVMVSVIVPVYNCEDYLPRCINSLLEQTMHELEIILIDDGSIDNSGLIMDQYAQNDDRIKVIRQKNQGVGFARNKGLDSAAGKYTCFVDSDDWIEKDCLFKAVNAAESTDADVIVFGYRKHFINSIQNDLIYSDFQPGLHFDIPKALTIMHQNGLLLMLGNKLYRNVPESLRFTSMPLYEDAQFTYHYLYQCKSIYFIKDILYNYVKYEKNVRQSATARVFPDVSMTTAFPLFDTGMELYRLLCIKYPDNPCNQEFQKRLEAHLLTSIGGDFLLHLPYLKKGYKYSINYIKDVSMKARRVVNAYPSSGGGIVDLFINASIHFRLPHLSYLLGLIRSRVK